MKVSPRVIIQRKLPDLPPAGVLYLQVEELGKSPSLGRNCWRNCPGRSKHGVDWEPAPPGTARKRKGLLPGYLLHRKRPRELMFSLMPGWVGTGRGGSGGFSGALSVYFGGTGEVLAVKHPRTGPSGTSVRGEVIFCPLKDCALPPGKELCDQGRAVVAAHRTPRGLSAGKGGECVFCRTHPSRQCGLASGNVFLKGMLVSNNVRKGCGWRPGQCEGFGPGFNKSCRSV